MFTAMNLEECSSSSATRLHRVLLECRPRIGSAYLTCRFVCNAIGSLSSGYSVRVQSERDSATQLTMCRSGEILARLKLPDDSESLKSCDYSVDAVCQMESCPTPCHPSDSVRDRFVSVGGSDGRNGVVPGGTVVDQAHGGGITNCWLTARLPLATSTLSGPVSPVDSTENIVKQWLPSVGCRYQVWCAQCSVNNGGSSTARTGAAEPVACLGVRRCLPLPTDNWEHAAADAFCCTGVATVPASAASRGRPGCASEGDVLTSTAVTMVSAQCLHRIKCAKSSDNNNVISSVDKSNHVNSDRCNSTGVECDVLCAVCGHWLGQLTADGVSVRLWRHRVVWRMETQSEVNMDLDSTEKKVRCDEELESSVTAGELLWRLLVEHAEQAPTRVLITSCQQRSPHGLLVQLLDKTQLKLLSWLPLSASKLLERCQQLVVLKVLYREISDAQQLRGLRQDFSVDLLSLDQELWQVLISQLQQTSSWLPPDQRSVLEFSVGWITKL